MQKGWQQPRRWLLPLIALVASVTLLSACDHPEKLWQDYLKRLSRVLNEPIPEARALELPTYPAKKQLFVTPLELNISLLNAWSMNHCELFSLIGQRNSILGKVDEPELRADYEWRFLQSLPACIDDARTEPELRQRLLTIQQRKQNALTTALWNATFANQDFFHQFSLSERMLAEAEQLDMTHYGDQLARLTAWYQQPSASPLAALLAVSGTTSQFALAGSALLSQRLATTRLHQANQMLSKATASRYLCPGKLTRPELATAQSVLHRVFIGRLQPWLLEVTAAYENSLGRSAELLLQFPADQFAEQQARVNRYFNEAEVIKSLFVDTIKAHTARWQALLQQCGLSIGGHR